MRPADVGWTDTRLVLGKHSGRHGLAFRLSQLGFDLDREALDAAYRRFVELADRQKEVVDDDLRRLVAALPQHMGTPSPNGAAAVAPLATRGAS
jgi:2-isopropylmalate synthase